MSNRRLSTAGYIVGGVSAVFGAVVAGYFYLKPEPAVITQEDGTEIIFPQGAKFQETASIEKDYDGREYLIWEGHVVEEPDNLLKDGGNISVSYDADIYNFDLGVIIHGGYNGSSLTRTLFNDLADENGNLPPHIERVKKIGCDIAEEYFARETSGEYQATPDDVRGYHNRHCGLE